MQPVTNDARIALINNTWKPTLCITGIDGLPCTAVAGNVLRPLTTVKLSIRLPPTLDPHLAAKKLKEIIEKDPPYGAEVKLELSEPCPGWNAKPLTQKVQDSIN